MSSEKLDIIGLFGFRVIEKKTLTQIVGRHLNLNSGEFFVQLEESKNDFFQKKGKNGNISVGCK